MRSSPTLFTATRPCQPDGSHGAPQPSGADRHDRHSDYRLDYLGSPLKQYTLGTANAIALRFLDFYQPVADRMARTLIERGFDPERIVKIYNGMDFDRPEGEFDRAAYLRDTYGAEIEDGDVLCGIAARLTAVKDIATTIRALPRR